MKRGNKRGLELAIGTVVIIVLAVLVLIALLVIFDRQTGIFSDFLANLMGKTNVDTLVTSCNALATQNSVYEYCCVEKKVKYKADGKIIEEELTCKELEDKSFVGGMISKLNCENAC